MKYGDVLISFLVCYIMMKYIVFYWEMSYEKNVYYLFILLKVRIILWVMSKSYLYCNIWLLILFWNLILILIFYVIL